MRMRIAIALLLTSGCASSPSESSGDDVGAPPSGTYHVRSHIDLTAFALLPEPAADLVVTLRDFSQAPSRTLFDLADDAGVPAVGTVRAALPSALESRLYGWIDGEIAKLKLDGVPVTMVAGNVAALAESALSQFALDSTLVVDGDAATHTLTTLDLTPAGLDATFDLTSAPSAIIEERATCAASSSSLSIGDHTFGIPYGEYVWRAVGGDSLRAALGAAVNCPALAQRVALTCYLGVCVGHASELTQICERGLDEVVDRAGEKVLAMRIDALHFAAGHAKLVDADHDGVVERLDGGVWTAEINAGQGLRHVPATFSAEQ